MRFELKCAWEQERGRGMETDLNDTDSNKAIQRRPLEKEGTSGANLERDREQAKRRRRRQEQTEKQSDRQRHRGKDENRQTTENEIT